MGGRDVEVERLLEAARRRVHERAGHGATDVVDDQVEPAEGIASVLHQPGHGIEVAQVGRHNDGPAPGGPHLCGHFFELVDAAGRDDHVGPCFGQAHGGRSTQAASGTGDDGDLVVHPESIENHVRLPLRRLQ